MAQATAQNPPANLTFQGIVVPGSALNPQAFFAATRRQTVLQRTLGTWGGFGNTDVVDTLRAGILAGYTVKVAGTLTVDPSTGSVATTSAWPYGILKSAVFQANGQSNLINASGWHLRVREIMADPSLSDRGVEQGVGGTSPGTTVNQGTLAMASESWGVGNNVQAIASGSYDVELSFYVPVAFEKQMLTGAVFCQTLSTTLELDLNWANLSDVFTIASPGSVTFEPSVTVEAEMFTIPSDGQGGMWLPNLSAFHSYVTSRAPNAISQGNNEIVLSGQGVGRQLERLVWRVQQGSPAEPVIPTAAQITDPYWRYGTNTTPETWVDARDLRYQNERNYDSDIGAVAGFSAIDFARTWAFRDSVNEGSATELRFGFSLVNAPVSPATVEYSQDVILAGAAA